MNARRLAALWVGDGERFRPWGLILGIALFLLMLALSAFSTHPLDAWDTAAMAAGILGMASLLTNLVLALASDRYD